MGLAALTTAGLAVVAWRELQAGPALERAMAEALGADWRTAIDPELAARLRRHLPLARILLLPLSRPAATSSGWQTSATETPAAETSLTSIVTAPVHRAARY